MKRPREIDSKKNNKSSTLNKLQNEKEAKVKETELSKIKLSKLNYIAGVLGFLWGICGIWTLIITISNLSGSIFALLVHFLIILGFFWIFHKTVIKRENLTKSDWIILGTLLSILIIGMVIIISLTVSLLIGVIIIIIVACIIPCLSSFAKTECNKRGFGK
ncbi:MAG: hypothetical protein ABIA21_03740 [Candidatus Aenigmatarchaeota archaeon]